MKTLRLFAVAVSFSATLLSGLNSLQADEYDDSQSNPIRVAAYLLHPAGVLLEWTVFRPLHFLVSSTPEAEYVFGHTPHPPLFTEPRPLYDFGVSNRVPMPQAETPKAAAPQEPVAETVTVKEVPVEKTVIKEVPKIVEQVVFPDIAFRFDSSQLTELGKGQVYLAAQKLKEKSDIVIVIEGNTDSIGTAEYNEKLGLRRAETVRKELARLGIEAERMSVVSFGESKPLIDQKTGWARAVNRRVEFEVKAR